MKEEESLNLTSAIWFAWGVLLNSGIGNNDDDDDDNAQDYDHHCYHLLTSGLLGGVSTSLLFVCCRC